MSDDDITIRIGETPHTILCGICKTPIRKRAEADGDAADFGCAACGNWAEQEKLSELITEFAKIEMQLQANRMLRDTGENISFATFSGQTEHDRSHPFVIELKI